ncbi:MAG: 50S ribosomal protein L9 [Bacteroidales bacterium]
MEIILLEDIQRLGHKDDVVEVKNGYANNYLIPNRRAKQATPSAKKVHAENIRQRAHKEAKFREAAQALAQKLEGMQVKLSTKVSETGKIFGSINNIQIAEALKAEGVEVDRRNITINDIDAVKEVGVYEVTVKCYKDIKATVKIEIVGE